MIAEVTAFLETSREALRQRPDVNDLHTLRQQLDSTKLEENLRLIFKTVNDPDVLSNLRDLLVACQREAEDRASALADDQDIERRFGVSVGGGMIGAGALALVATANPVTLIIIGGGAFMAWRARKQSSAFTEQIVALGQVATRCKDLAQLYWKDR